MQISRHWRLNANRYRLEGVRYETGKVSLQERPLIETEIEKADHQTIEASAHSEVARVIAAA